MSVGGLDLLTIILQDDVEQHGIPFLRTKFEDGLSEEDVAKWDKFWDYFQRTWMPIMDSWNICKEDGEYKEILNRTNNGLEIYNMRFNNLFLKKPSLLEFVETLEKETLHHADLLDLLRRGTIVCRRYKEVTIPSIPPEYRAFKRRNNRCFRR